MIIRPSPEEIVAAAQRPRSPDEDRQALEQAAHFSTLAYTMVGLAAFVFAAWAVISLLTGKTYQPRAGLFGDIVDRRTDPGSYWFIVALTSALAVAMVVALFSVT